MNHALAVGVIQGGSHVAEQRGHPPEGQRAVRGHPIGQVSAGHVVERHIQPAVALLQVQHAHDAFVIQAGGGARFGYKAQGVIGPAGVKEGRAEQLQGDRLLQGDVLAAIDDSERAAAQLFEDAVAADGAAVVGFVSHSSPRSSTSQRS